MQHTGIYVKRKKESKLRLLHNIETLVFIFGVAAEKPAAPIKQIRNVMVFL